MASRMKSALGLAGLLLAGGALQAQSTHFGLQGTLAYPTSDLGAKDLLDDSLGYGLGAHLVIGFAGGHAIVPRVDYAYFEKSNPTRKVEVWQVGADYDYFLSGQVNQGAYVGAGLGLGLARFEVNAPGMSDNDTPNTTYGSVSAGYLFTPHLGAEIRYVYAKYKPELFWVKEDITAPTVNASFIYRF